MALPNVDKDTYLPVPSDEWLVKVVSDEALNDSDKALTVPANEEWIVTAVRVNLVTSVDVGNRLVACLLDDGAGTPVVLAGTRPTVNHAASTTYNYLFQRGWPTLPTAVVGTTLHAPLPDMLLKEGMRVHVLDEAAIAAEADDMKVYATVLYREVRASKYA